MIHVSNGFEGDIPEYLAQVTKALTPDTKDRVVERASSFVSPRGK